ncbi:MAG: hypothetical protein HY023_08210 [Chloroflexi bacterium]|nr:hypothetical protein [Chloroflexota bacterium]
MKDDMRKPLIVEIVAYAPTAFYHCTHCEVVWREVGFNDNFHKEQVASALPADVAQDYQAVSDWVRRVFSRDGPAGRLYCDGVIVKVIDAASVEGFWKTVRHGLRRYPAVVVGGKTTFTGTDFASADAEIARQLEAVPVT